MDRWNLVPVLEWWSALGLVKPSLLVCWHSVILQGRLNVPTLSNGMKGDCSLRWYDFSNPLRPFSHPHVQWVLRLRGAGPVPQSLNCESEHTLRVESSGFPGEAKTLLQRCLLHILLWETAPDGSKKQSSRVTPSPATLEGKRAFSGIMETKLYSFQGGVTEPHRDRQLISKRPWKEARSPGQATAVGTEHKDSKSPRRIIEDSCGSLGPRAFSALPPTVILSQSLWGRLGFCRR